MTTGIIEGILGAIGGAGNAAADQALIEQKQQYEAVREQRLSGLRMAEHAANTEADLAAKKKFADQDAAERKAFYERTANAPGKVTTSTYTDNVGDDAEGSAAGGIIETARAPSRKDLADYRLEEAKKTGKTDLITQSYAEAKDIRAEEEQDRKGKSDEQKAKAAERLAAIKDLEVAIKEKDAETRARKVDALIAKALSPNGEKEPAKIKEVKALADMAFDGDIQKAVAFAYGSQDKDRTSAVMQMANVLKADLTLANDPEKLMAKAETMVDALRNKASASRGGVSTKSTDAPADEAEGIMDQIRASNAGTNAPRPKTKAEYDALPSGALYFNPKMGKVVRKP